jgi:hypothetical protein
MFFVNVFALSYFQAYNYFSQECRLMILVSKIQIVLKGRVIVDGVNHLVEYLKSPNKLNAVDSQAIARFGIMPASTLPVAELRAVAGWVWDQYNPAMGRGRGFGGQGAGRGRMNPY